MSVSRPLAVCLCSCTYSSHCSHYDLVLVYTIVLNALNVLSLIYASTAYGVFAALTRGLVMFSLALLKDTPCPPFEGALCPLEYLWCVFGLVSCPASRGDSKLWSLHQSPIGTCMNSGTTLFIQQQQCQNITCTRYSSMCLVLIFTSYITIDTTCCSFSVANNRVPRSRALLLLLHT